jgi:hypothetical protein
MKCSHNSWIEKVDQPLEYPQIVVLRCTVCGDEWEMDLRQENDGLEAD